MSAARAKVTLVGGDPVMGRSLEALLQAAGYDAEFRQELSAEVLCKLLVASHLLLVAPGLNAKSREALTRVVMSRATKIPILELLSANDWEAVGIHEVDGVPWPCPVEELRRRIRGALLA